LWTSDRRARHGVQDNTSAYLQDEDTVNHVLAACVFSRQVWHQCLHNPGLVVEIPTANGEWNEWWLSTSVRVRMNERVSFDSGDLGELETVKTK
jgi:hypothetical protein